MTGLRWVRKKWLTLNAFLGVGFNVELGESNRASWACQDIFVLKKCVPDRVEKTAHRKERRMQRGATRANSSDV